MNRRKFLGIAGKSIIAAAAAPVIVRAESIMRVKPILTMEDIYDFSPISTPWIGVEEQEMLSAIESAFENGGSPDRLSRAFHRELLPELYPDYWPSYQAHRGKVGDGVKSKT